MKTANVSALENGKRYQVSEVVPMMPAIALDELSRWRRARIVYLKPGQSFRVVQVRSKRFVPWYRVKRHWWSLSRWINSMALVGKSVQLVGPVARRG